MKIKLGILLLLSVLTVTGCNSETTEEKKEDVIMEEMKVFEAREITDYKKTDEVTNFVMIDVKDYGEIVIELYPEVAPISVANFQDLVKDNFYEDIIFHRVIENFMIQGGDPDGNGTGGSPDTIKGEFQNNGVNNTLSHTRGVISMARTSIPDSASSQFFIVHADSTYLDKDYAAFGQVLLGMDVVDKIASMEVEMSDKPLEDIKMNSISFVEISE